MDEMEIDTPNKKTEIVTKVLMVLAIVGALNWGLIGFFDWNLVDAIFGGGTREATSIGSRVVYAIVGIAGLISLGLLPQFHAEPAEERSLADRPV
jgi:uncharacterized membrane protein YuzA (DUF378 family)